MISDMMEDVNVDGTKTIRLVYLGKRGGGLNLLNETLVGLFNLGIQPEVFFNTKLKSDDFAIERKFFQPREIYCPTNIRDLTKIRKIIVTLNHSRNFYIKRKASKTYFVMPSPFDILFYILNIGGYTSFGLHDPKSHSGEIWPTSRTIKRRIKFSDEIVCFSNAVANQIVVGSQKIYVCKLPNQFFLKTLIRKDVKSKMEQLATERGPVIAIIGRIKGYKNLEEFYQLADEVDHSIKFLIAGQGKRAEHPRINQIDMWLTDTEIDFVIDRIDVAYLAYKDATQSGMIPILIEKNKKIIISEFEGLIEQCLNYPNHLILSQTDSNKERSNQILSFIHTGNQISPPIEAKVSKSYWEHIINTEQTLKEIF